jgi:hypothetical protein
MKQESFWPVKYIYFPLKDELPKIPYVVFIIDRTQKELRGSADYSEIQEGRYRWYPLSRCRIFSDELMKKCLIWAKRKEELDQSYFNLIKKGHF